MNMPDAICFRSFLRAAILSGALLLAGCAGMAPVPVSNLSARDAMETFSLEGRFSLRQEEKNHSGRMSWRHAATGDELLLASPFGQGVAEISVGRNGATLTTSDGRAYAAADAQALTEQVLGYSLPLALLADWVRGRSLPEQVAERDALGRPLRLRHEDWFIEYGYDSDDPQALPGRLFAERVGAFELRLKIDEWNGLEQGGRKP